MVGGLGQAPEGGSRCAGRRPTTRGWDERPGHSRRGRPSSVIATARARAQWVRRRCRSDRLFPVTDHPRFCSWPERSVASTGAKDLLDASSANEGPSRSPCDDPAHGRHDRSHSRPQTPETTWSGLLSNMRRGSSRYRTATRGGGPGGRHHAPRDHNRSPRDIARAGHCSVVRSAYGQQPASSPARNRLSTRFGAQLGHRRDRWGALRLSTGASGHPIGALTPAHGHDGRLERPLEWSAVPDSGETPEIPTAAADDEIEEGESRASIRSQRLARVEVQRAAGREPLSLPVRPRPHHRRAPGAFGAPRGGGGDRHPACGSPGA